MTEHEQKIIESVDEKCIQHPKYWMSLVWAGAVVTRAKKEGRIKDDFAFRTIIKEINKFRSGCGGLLDYDWISIPLVYTQVVTLAVYTFFLSSLMGRQFLDPSKNFEGHEVDLYVPVFTFLQFFFYMGWLKVAEVLINPFGEDDDDFEMNWLIDRNLQVAYLIVDEMHAEHPELVKDAFWDDGVPDELPYTLAAEEFRQADPWQGSTAEVEVPEDQSEFVYLDTIEEGPDDDEFRKDVDDEEIGLNVVLKDIKIDGDGSTKPLSIGNGKLKSVRESIASNVASLGVRRNESSTSVMGLIRRALQGPESGTESGAGVGSVLSINSRGGGGQGGAGGNVTRTASRTRVRGKRRRRGYNRSVSNASPMSHEGLSRVNTHEQAIFKMSDTSSVNSLNSESNFPSRANSEATALFEVREILRKDLVRRKSCHELDEDKRKSLRKDERSSDADILKKKLIEVQKLQLEITKSLSLDNDVNLHKDSTSNLNPDVAIHLLEQKTAELKKAYIKTTSDHATEDANTSPTHEPEGGLGVKTRRSRHPSWQTEPLTVAADKIVRGFTSPAPASPTPRPDPLAGEMSEHPKPRPLFPISSNLGSETSFKDELFEMEQEEADDEQDGSFEDEDEPRSVVENIPAPQNDSCEPDMDGGSNYYEQSWDNLGTIEEQPELGYQSDSNETSDLLASKLEEKKQTKSDANPLLPTVQEER